MLQNIIYKTPEILFDDIKNKFGCIRVNKVRSAYYADNGISLDDVVNFYKEWRDKPEHIILSTTNEYEMDLIGAQEYVEPEFLCIKAAKRGNDVYKYLISQKWNKIKGMENVSFFKDNWGVKQTSMLSITLTYNTSRGPVEAAWETFGEDFHLWLAKMRQEYGAFEFIRVWESHKNFYPHAHVIIALKGRSLQVWTEHHTDGSKSYRISQEDTKKISGFWHSFVDVKAVSDTKTAMEHLTKYITKDLMGKKGDKTNAMLWFFGKQSYAIGKNFFRLVNRQFADVDLSEPELGDLIKTNMANCNKVYEFIGIFPTSLLKIDPWDWYKTIKHPPPVVRMEIWNQALKAQHLSY